MYRLFKHHRVVFIFLLMITLLMTACGTSNEPDVELLPTVASLPTVSDTLVPAEQPTLPPTWTPTATESVTPSPSATQTFTITPSLTITDTPTIIFTPSITPSQIPRPIVDLVQLAYEATILPNDYVVPERDGINVTLPPTTPEVETIGGNGEDESVSPDDGSVIVLTTIPPDVDLAVTCPFYPVGGFAEAYTSDAVMAQLLGCPTGNPPITFQVNGAYQVFERGTMIWLEGSPNRIYALYNNGTYQRFADTFDENVDPETGGETPPEGLFEPTRGFGKVWRNQPSVKSNLGWAYNIEIADLTTIQDFTRGQMVYIPTRGDVLALVMNSDGSTGTWKSLDGSF